MAFDLVAAGGYGSGKLGDVTDPVGIINTTAIIDTEQSIAAPALIDKQIGIYGDFAAGDDILISVAGMSDNEADVEQGLWCIASISSIEDGYFTMNPYIYDEGDAWNKIWVLSRNPPDNLQITVTSIPHFRNLTLNQGCMLTPRAGFPLAFKCSGTLTLNGGHIDLRNKGTIVTNARPLTAQEQNGTKDTDKYSGWENSQTKDNFILNVGDGAAFIIAKTLNVANSASRIGNPTFTGVQFCRGASDSPNLPANATNVGGSTILIAAETIANFAPDIIAKYRDATATAGIGVARCYIASNTLLRNDEGLYAYDCISNPQRLADMNITSFGDGSSGNSALSAQINNYALVTAVDETKQVLTVSGMTTVGSEPFALGRLVMVHFTHKTNSYTINSGKFILAKILGINDADITLDTAVLDISLDNYYCQIITVPQFENYTLAETNSATPAFKNGKGGIFAIAVNDTCDLSGGIINVMEKGGGKAYGRGGLAAIGNAQDAAKLPIGQGHGSVFILAKNLTMNSNTRIGATYSGAKTSRDTFAGRGGGLHERKDIPDGGGYGGLNGNQNTTAEATEIAYNYYYGGRGWGGAGGLGSTYASDSEDRRSTGGYGSNGYATATYSDNGLVATDYGMQGAHVMIIANTITGFNQAAISTGGEGAPKPQTGNNCSPGSSGSAGYGGGGTSFYNSINDRDFAGGGGGYNGGGGGNYSSGGGGSGWAFIYCNNVVNQDTTDTVLL